MRDIITGLAIMLLLALTAALVGPHVVDWNQHRDEINARLSAAVGQPVEVRGAIGLTLLPKPELKLGQVRLAGAGPMTGDVGRIKITAALPPLLKGQIRITEALVQGGTLTVDSAAALPGGLGPDAQGLNIAIDKLAIAGVTLVVRASESTALATFANIEGQVEATALDGPFRGSLAFTAADARRVMRFSTGRITGPSLRLRATSENEQAAARVEFDGTVAWPGGVPALDGKLSASGNAPVALSDGLPNLLWRASAQVKGNAQRATADQIEIAVGHADRQALLTGVADVSLLPTPGITATLATRQVDLDRFLAGEDNRKPPTPEALVKRVAGLLKGDDAGALLPLTGTADISVGSVVLGGGVVVAPRIVVAVNSGDARVVRAEGEFPGRARLSFAHDTGAISADVRDMPALTAWFQGDSARPGLVRALAVDGAFALTASGFRVSGGTVRADDMRFSGSLEADIAGERSRMTAVLEADQLDIAKLPDFGQGNGEAGFDLDLRLDARRVRYNGVGAGAIRTALVRTGSELAIRELTVRDLGGASMRATGVLGGTAPQLTAEVQAERLEALLELLDKLLPHPSLPYLKARARALAPANIRLVASPAVGETWKLGLTGKLGGTDVTGALVLDGAGDITGSEGLRLDLAAPLAGPLLRKLGLQAIDIPGAGPVRLSLAGAGAGPAAAGAPWSLRGNLGATTIEFSGVVKPDPAEPFAGRLRLDSRDLAPLAQTLLVTVPQVQPGQSMRLEGGVDFRNYRLTIRDMDAALGQVPVKGEIAFNLLEFGRVAGQLRTPYVDIGSVTPLIFGVAPPSQEGWSAAAFAPASPVTLPGDLWIEAGQVRLADGILLDEPKFVLRFDNGLIFLDHANARFAGAGLNAQATLRRNGPSVSVAGRLAFKDASALAGAANGELEFTGLGDSPAQLVAGLNGGGVARFRELKLPALPRQIFADLAAQRERNELLSRQALSDRLRQAARETLSSGAGETRLSLASGVLRAGPLSLADGANNITAGLTIDLRNQSISGRMAYAAMSTPKDWNGPLPQAVLIWRGLPRNPILEAEADEFANGLTALAIRRESDRIDMLEQDQRERAFFNRRLRSSEDARRAEAEQRRQEALQRQQEQLQRQQAERDRLQRLRDEALQNTPPLMILPPAVR